MLNKIAQLPNKVAVKDTNKRKIGFVSIWFNRGLSYVTKNIVKVLENEKDVEVFIYAKYGVNPEDPEKLIVSRKADWKANNITYSYDCNIQQWAEWNKLDIVVFLESYYNNENLTRLKLEGRKTVLVPMCEYIDKNVVNICKSYLMDKVLSLTKFGKEILVNNGVPEEKISCVPYAIETKRISKGGDYKFVKQKGKRGDELEGMLDHR